MARSRKSSKRRGIGPLVFGVLVLVLLGALVWRSSEPKDWKAVGTRLLDERDHALALEAFDRHLRRNPDDPEALFLRARAERALRMRRKALDDVERALEHQPDSLELLAFKAGLLAESGDHEGAILTLDDACERAPRQFQPRALAANARLRWFRFLKESILRRLRDHHRDPIVVDGLLAEYFAARRSPERFLESLTEPLPSEPFREKLARDLEEARRRLHEADRILGDLRRIKTRSSTASLARAEIDVEMGRLLRAKEELQIFLRSSRPPGSRRRALELLARLFGVIGAHNERAKRLWSLVEERGGEEEAPMSLVADAYEASFLAAGSDEGRRAAWIGRAEERLARPGPRDLRTLAWRGVAAFEWEGDVEGAIARLEEVYRALRMQRFKDDGLLDPGRVRRFMSTLLEAYLATGQPGRGLDVATALVQLSPDDPELRRRRARLLETTGDDRGAARDLLHALRHSPRDPALFEHWLRVADRVEDASGRTPPELAREGFERYRRALEAFRGEIRGARDETEREVRRLVRPERRFREAIDRIGDIASKMADDPVLAWHLAEEFARAGAVLESRNFLFEAWAMEPDVPQFLFRLAQFRYALGLFRPAAEDFERIWSRDVEDLEAGRLAVRAWRRAGEPGRARAIVRRTMEEAEGEAAWALGADWSLLEGDAQRALRMISLHSGPTPSRFVRRLRGWALLEVGRLAQAAAQLQTIVEEDPQDSEALLGRALCAALRGRRGRLAKTLELWNAVPLVEPTTALEEIVERVAQAGRFREAGDLALGFAERLGEEDRLRLRQRAAVLRLRAGDPGPLEELRDAPGVTAKLDDDFVRAAFAHTLTVDGPEPAARFLVRARAYSSRGTFGLLETAAAFALTPFSVDRETYLLRYARRRVGEELSEREALLFALASRGVELDPASSPRIPVDLEPEAALLRGELDDELADEVTTVFLLDFGGAPFEDRVVDLGRRVTAREPRLQGVARLVAGILERRDGVEAALAYLVPLHREVPSDPRTFDLLVDLLRRSDATAAQLVPFVPSARRTHPGRLSMRLLAFEAALRAGQGERALGHLQAAMVDAPPTPQVLDALAEVADRFGLEDAAGRLVVSLREGAPLTDRARAYLLERYSDPSAHHKEALALLPRLLARQPEDIELAVALARHLAASEATDWLRKLAREAALTTQDRPDAPRHLPALLQLASILERARLLEEAELVLDAAVAADPVSIAARRARARHFDRHGEAGTAIVDLAALCTLVPADPRVHLDYAETLLEERTDRSEPVEALLAHASELAPGDARVPYLRGRLAFGRDDLDEARSSYRAALAREPDLHRARYHLAVASLLAGESAEARRSLEALPADFAFKGRVRILLEDLTEAAP